MKNLKRKTMLGNFDKNKNPFKVPENYFEGLTKDIMNSLPSKESQVKRVALWRKVLPWTGVAAIVAAVAIAVGTWGEMPKMIAEETEGQEIDTHQQKMAYNEAEDYFLFLEDESTEAQYIDVLFDEL